MTEILLNKPTITNFESKYLGDASYVIYKTTVEELVVKSDNTPIIDAQIRALTAALKTLKERVSP